MRSAASHSARIVSTALLLAATTALSSPARADWLTNGNPICTDTHAQVSPSIIGDGASGAIITWSDQRFGSNNDIFAQRIDSTGAVLWSANGVAVCTAIKSQVSPVAALGFDGGASIFWSDSRSNTNSDIYGQRLNAQGVPQWPTNGIALSTDNPNAIRPVAIPDGGAGITLPHGYIVAWQESDAEDPGIEGIAVQHIDVNGGDLWTPAAAGGVRLCSDLPTVYSFRIATDGVGTLQGRKGAVAVWSDLRAGSTTGSDIHARRVDSSGGLLWGGNGLIVCDVTGDQQDPDIVNVGGGNVIAAWDDQRTPDRDLYAQELNSSGVAQWLADGLPICRATGAQTAPRLAPDGTGGAIATWDDFRSGSTRVYAQRIDGNGQPLWATDGIPLSPVPGGTQSNPTILSDQAGGAIVVWIDTRNGGEDIYAQRVDANGNLLWSNNGSPVCIAANAQNPVVAISDSKFGAVAAWTDIRAANQDVYATRLFAESGAVDVAPSLPRGLGLAFVSAHPASGLVRMRLDLPAAASVTMEVLDALGRRVRSRDAGAQLAAGTHDLTWNGDDDSGHAVAAGVYFVRVQAGAASLTKRVVEIR